MKEIHFAADIAFVVSILTTLKKLLFPLSMSTALEKLQTQIASTLEIWSGGEK
jgi:hypothetical protein